MSGLRLFAFGTPNGKKITVFMEVLRLNYELIVVNIAKNEQKQPDFIKLNPNGRIPTLVDESKGITISQTGAILQYLADQYDPEHKYSYKVGTNDYYKQLELVAFQLSEGGPSQGQNNHFKFMAKEKIDYAIERFNGETKRVYGVLNDYLQRNESNGPYLVGNHYSIADFAWYSWATTLDRVGIDTKEWPNVELWLAKLGEIPEVKRGMDFDQLKHDHGKS